MKKLFGYSDDTKKAIDNACDEVLRFLKWIFTLFIFMCIAGIFVFGEIIMKILELIFQ